MKKLFILALLALAGCTETPPTSPTVNRPEGAVLEIVATRSNTEHCIHVYAITVDGQRYLIVQGDRGISVCPAPKK